MAPVAPARAPLAKAASTSPGRAPHVVFALGATLRGLYFENVRGPLLPETDAVSHWAAETEMADARNWVEALTRWRPEVLVTGWSTPRLPQAWLSNGDCPLRYVCHVAGSVRGVVPRDFLTRGGRVTNWGGTVAPQVAEHALLLALAALRRVPEWSRERPEGYTVAALGTRTLFHKTVGLHGFGHVARALVGLLAPFDVEVVAFSPGVPPELIHSHGVVPCGSLIELCARSEVIFECEALTPATEGSVDAEALAALADGSVFVNVGRGRVVDEPALVREAASGRIRVAVDVQHSEPPPADSLLATTPGVIVSPHIAGPTHDRLPACGELALRNVAAYLRGEPLESEITLEIYDRST